jgi:hypothetical protein
MTHIDDGDGATELRRAGSQSPCAVSPTTASGVGSTALNCVDSTSRAPSDERDLLLGAWRGRADILFVKGTLYVYGSSDNWGALINDRVLASTVSRTATTHFPFHMIGFTFLKAVSTRLLPFRARAGYPFHSPCYPHHGWSSSHSRDCTRCSTRDGGRCYR